MNKYYSHPGKLLIDHLREVGEVAYQYSLDALKNKDISNIARIIGYFHDFGKYTKFFQKHLEKELNGPKTHHSLLSAVFLFDYLNKKMKDTYYPLIAYISVYSHHTNLKSIEEITPKTISINEQWENNKDILHIQINEGLYKNSVQEDFSKLVKDFTFKDFDLESTLTSIEKSEYLFLQEEEKIRREYIAKLYVLFSSLIDADKKNAGKVQTFERKKISNQIVNEFKEKHFANLNSPINKIRNSLYDQSIKNLDRNKNIFSLTAPTGSGKTLTAINLALQLKKGDQKRRIIYVLPFTSIIDQNFDVIHKVLSSIKDFNDNESMYLLKYHHLANVEYKNYQENIPIEKALSLIESWDPEIIITTFIQFFESVFGFRNYQLKKYHNIANSIILLDEIQSIPIKYWYLVEKILKFLANNLQCKIILMTATKPLILKETKELSNPQYFTKMNRVRIEYTKEEQNLEEFAEAFLKNYDPSKSYLVILSTIRTSIDLYNMLEKEFKNIHYLSSSIIPKDRLEKIKKIKSELNDKLSPILISTQVVEAGVDIDFDVVYRDIAPIDSIIQSSGRCNRNSSKNMGEVKIIKLREENKPLYANYVYGKISIDIAENILDKNPYFEEKDFMKIFNLYLKEVSERKSQDESKKLWRNFLEFNFTSLSEFKLIENIPGYIDVFVEADEEAKNIWNFFEDKVLKEEDMIKRKINYIKIRKSFREYIVSAPKKIVVDFCEEHGGGIIKLSNDRVDDYYSQTTGIITKISDEPWII